MDLSKSVTSMRHIRLVIKRYRNNKMLIKDKVKYCEWCKEPYLPKSKANVYCSTKCSQAAKRERKRSPIKQVITGFENAHAQPADKPCPICGSINGFTDANIAVCPQGHQWAIIGSWQEEYNKYAKVVWHILEHQFKKELQKRLS